MDYEVSDDEAVETGLFEDVISFFGGAYKDTILIFERCRDKHWGTGYFAEFLGEDVKDVIILFCEGLDSRGSVDVDS